MTKSRSVECWNRIFFGLLWVVYILATGFLFYKQALYENGTYPSDIIPYIQHAQGEYTGYDFPYPIMFWMARLFGRIWSPQLSMALAITILNGMAVVFLKYYVDKYVKRVCNWRFGTAIFSTLLTFSMLFVSMLFLDLSPESIGFRYRGVFSPNPFHNATYLATRPFTIVCFFLFVDLLQEYEEKVDKKKYVLFSLFLLLTTMTKPSFSYGFIITAALILFYRFCRRKFANIKETFLLALCAVPSFGALLYQFRNLFMGTNPLGQEAGIGIGFLKAWELVEKPIWEVFLLGLAFPLAILLCNIKNLKEEKEFCYSVQMLLVNILMVLFLYEKGFRMLHMNFAWGYMHGMFFAYVASTLLLVKNTIQKKQPLVLLGLQWILYLWHLVCGVVYFAQIMQGKMFY